MADGRRRDRVRHPRTLFGTAALLALAFFALMCGSASAVSTHPLDHSFSVGPNCGGGDADLAYVESTQLVYVFCSRNFPQGPEIRRFDLNGNPVPFSGSGPYINGNALTGTPDPNAENEEFGRPSTIAVDNSSAHNGFLYVASFWGPEDIDIFNPTGEWIGAIPTPGNAGTPMSVAIDHQGFIYAGASGGFGRGHISKFNPGFHEIAEDLHGRRKLGLHPPRFHRGSLGGGIQHFRSRRRPHLQVRGGPVLDEPENQWNRADRGSCSGRIVSVRARAVAHDQRLRTRISRHGCRTEHRRPLRRPAIGNRTL